MEWKLILVALVGLFGFYFVGSVLFRPLRFLIRLCAWAVLGMALLVLINLLFGRFGFHIAINPATILTAGLLQLPGVVLLVLLNCFFVG
ncbi:MAG: pro-sigmaK processing inhibitor BofA [Peptococcaceae bacterium]|nr:pro-sigmaK processing inhibitor BofA [Candidatus Syntrophopropionicum ammoniitolerans]